MMPLIRLLGIFEKCEQGIILTYFLLSFWTLFYILQEICLTQSRRIIYIPLYLINQGRMTLTTITTKTNEI